MGNAAILQNYLVLGSLLFTLGIIGFLTRRNVIIVFLCAELMLQGVSLSVVGFSIYHGTWSGQILTIFSLAIAAAEAGIALALFVMLFKRAGSLDVSIWQDLREPDQPPVEEDAAPVDETPDEPAWPHLTTAGRLPKKPRGILQPSGLPTPPPRETSGKGGAV